MSKITEVKSHLVDGVHKADLSHNKDKTEWYVTIKGEFYTEFTFKTLGAANDMYILCLGSTNIFMDSLLVSVGNKMSDAEVTAYEEGR